MTGYYRIVEWQRYQHYKDRNPPWIKLHRDLLTSRTWVSLDDAGRVLAVACMLIAADTDNEIPADPSFVRRRAYLDADPDLSKLVEVGFLEYVKKDKAVADDSDTQADARQADASTPQAEFRPEAEAEAEQSKSSDPDGSGAEAPSEEMPELPAAFDRRGGNGQDPVKALFDLGVDVLTATGNTEKQARGLVGKWRKQAGDDVLASILVQARSKTEPVAYIERAVAETAQRKAKGAGYKPIGVGG